MEALNFSYNNRPICYIGFPQHLNICKFHSHQTLVIMKSKDHKESWKDTLIAAVAAFAAMIAASRWFMGQLARRAARMWFW